MEDNKFKPGQGPGKDNKPQRKGPKFNIYWIYGIMILLLIGLNFFSGSMGGGGEQMSFQEFRQKYLDKGQVEKLIVVNKSEVEVFLKQGAQTQKNPEDKMPFASNNSSSPVAKFTIGSVEQFEDNLKEAQSELPENERVRVIYENRGSFLNDILGSFLLPVIFLIAMWFFIMRKMGGGAGGGAGGGGIFNIGKSKAQLFEKGTRVNITFNDVAGLDEAKVEVMEIVDFLKNPKKYTALGGVYMKEGNNVDAMQHIDEAIRLDGSNYKAWYNKGVLLLRRGNKKEALGALNNAIRLKEYPKALFTRALLFQQTGNYGAAFQDAVKVISLEPGNARAHYIKADCIEQRGDIDGAIVEYTTAIQLEPAEPLFYLRRGLLLTQQNKNIDAIRDMSSAIQIRPEYSEAWYWRGMIKYRMGELPCDDLNQARNLGLPEATDALLEICNAH